MELAANPALDHHLIRATPRLSPDGYCLVAATIVASSEQKRLSVAGRAQALVAASIASR